MANIQDPGSYETAALECSLVPRRAALLGHSVDIADAANILNQHITDRLAAMPGRAGSSYNLHFVIPPDLAFTLRTASSELYRCNKAGDHSVLAWNSCCGQMRHAAVPGWTDGCSALK